MVILGIGYSRDGLQSREAFYMSIFCQRFQWPFVKLKELLSIKYTLLKLISKKFVTPNNFSLF